MAWTKEQSLAINTRNRTLLVSAAAGSGKTATLTERIIQSILDEESPADIGRMLIVTYTNAAVDELRERVGKAIKKAAGEHPENKRLEDQLLRLKDAKIMTITSFCNSILRSCADSISLPPAYRIAEPAEAKILSSSIMDALINAAYEGELCDVCSADEFITLADTLCDARYSDGISDAFSYVYGKLESSEGGIDSLLPLIEEYNPDKFVSPENTRLGAYIISYAKSAFKEYASVYEKLLRLASGSRLDEKNRPAAEGELNFMRECICAKSYEELHEKIFLYKGVSLSKSAKDEPSEFYSSFKQMRSYFSDDMKTLRTTYFSYSAEEWRNLYTKLYKLLNIFYKFLKKFYEVFSEEKRRSAVCEFSDIERYTYEALYDADGMPSITAKELSDKFDSIYVDEYQDVNALQNKIFAAIAKENNRFMVGDIKQSIYGFRSARPEIFAEMKNKFPSLGSEGDYPCASIFMSDNFRCDKSVVDFVNGIFDKLFGLLGGSIGYVGGDRLKFSKIYPDGSLPTNTPPEIHIIEKLSKDSADTVKNAEDVIENAEEDDKTNASVMAAKICEKISELIACGKLADGSPIEARHIAVLVRSVKSTFASALTEELRKINIASSLTDDSNLFLCNEVLLALSFLYSIDNPKKDIYLVALMCSPLFSFEADEILKIRKFSNATSVWDSLIAYNEAHADFEKGKNFAATLIRYRKLAESLPTDALLQIIYRESGLLALSAKSGGRDNLILLHSHAAKYEKSDFKGLYSFISYINALIEKDEKYPAANRAEDENSVKIMTVHKSKGLEFPVCIIANASAKIRSRSAGSITVAEGFGIALKHKDESGIAQVNNPAVNIINQHSANAEFEEELRVLYVALTRAREQLYVYATSPKTSAEEYIESINFLRDIDSPYFTAKAKSFLDMILISKDSGKVFIDAAPSAVAADEDLRIEYEEVSADSEKPSEERSSEAEEFKRRFEFKYPLSHLETLPEKISVSKLSPTILDEQERADVSLEDIFASERGRAEEQEPIGEKRAPKLPSFITGISEKLSAKRGIATHTVLQFCDFERLEQDGTFAEIERLITDEFISREDAELVRKKEIDLFVNSELFKKIKSSKKIHRELRFNVKLPADKFTEEQDKKMLLCGEEVLIQGVIDCLIEDSDGNLHIIDYKTDRLSAEELRSSELGDARLIAAHRRQLLYYADAAEAMFGKRPVYIAVYSLHMGREVEIK